MRALIVKEPWASLIVDGQKKIESRSQPTNIRERIGIIRAGSKLIIGEVDIVDCHVDSEMWGFEWILKNPKRYKTPRPYIHPRGAQVWVKIQDCTKKEIGDVKKKKAKY